MTIEIFNWYTDKRELHYDVVAVEDTPYGFRLRFEDDSYINFNSTYYWREIK